MAFQHAAANHAAVDVALRVDANALGAGVIRGGRLHVLDEGGDAAVARAANANALLDARQLARTGVDWPGFSIGDIDRVVGGNGNAARPSELPPLVEHLALLVVDHDAIVLAIADE